MTIKTIVAAMALERVDDPILARALQLAALHRARLVLVHVIESKGVPEGLSEVTDEEALYRTVEQDALNEMERQLERRAAGMSPDIIVKTGSAYEMVMEVAQTYAADLIVIGPGNARTIREKVFGSTADRIVRTALGPVLVARQALSAYERVAIAFDFSPPAKAALTAAISLAPAAGFELVQAVEIPLPFEQAMLKTGTSQAEIEQYRKARGRAARQELTRFIQKNFPSLPITPRILYGEAGASLVRLGRSRNVDLIAIGTHSRTVTSEFLLGSVAKRVLTAGNGDILVTSGG